MEDEAAVVVQEVPEVHVVEVLKRERQANRLQVVILLSFFIAKRIRYLHPYG